jgi:hypothetical protein
MTYICTELKNLRDSLQTDLADWAENYLSPGDDDYKALSEVMTDNGLEGLKRTFNVTVEVTCRFDVEVEATDEDAARDEVDNNINKHIDNNLDTSYPDEVNLDVYEV